MAEAEAAGDMEAFRCLAGSSGAESHVGRELGDYRLLQLIGEGGMGWVYLALHRRIGRRVAIKMLRPELNADPIAVRRFFEEARAVNRIQHDNIVQVHDFVENEDGATYLVLELLVGRDLLELIDSVDDPLPFERSLGIMVQTAQALAEVHECGVVHRDLKPENVFLVDRPGQTDLVKLLDFGIAKLRGGTNGRITKAGTSLGTPDYIAPEQALGADVDHRADIYSFGVILYELVTGRRPFASPDVTLTIARQVTEVPLRPGALRAMPAALERLVMECLAKHPDERPQTMGDVEARLREIVARLGEPDEAPAPAPAAELEPQEELVPAARWRPRRIALAGGVLFALVTGALALRGEPVETPAAAAGAGAAAAEVSPSLPRLQPAATATSIATAARAAVEQAQAAPPPAHKPRRARAGRPAAGGAHGAARPAGHSDVLPVYQD